MQVHGCLYNEYEPRVFPYWFLVIDSGKWLTTTIKTADSKNGLQRFIVIYTWNSWLTSDS